MGNEVKRTVKIRWVCDKTKCRCVNIRIISKWAVLFEDTCEKCNRYIHEPIIRIIKDE